MVLFQAKGRKFLPWTDKALQLKQAQTRVIDMNAVPEKGANIMKY